MSKKNQDVVPSGKDWAVKGEGNDRFKTLHVISLLSFFRNIYNTIPLNMNHNLF